MAGKYFGKGKVLEGPCPRSMVCKQCEKRMKKGENIIVLQHSSVGIGRGRGRSYFCSRQCQMDYEEHLMASIDEAEEHN